MKTPLIPRAPEPPPYSSAAGRDGGGAGTTATDQPRRSLFARLIGGFGRQGRLTRYILLLLAGFIVFFGLGGAYYVTTPRSYVSGFTLILPGSGAGASVNLESLGQTNTSSASAYSNPSLSPTQNYKRLIASDRVRGAVAVALDRPPEELPSPRIRLVDQTPLIFFRLQSGEAEDALVIAETWLDAFQHELDSLRDEEIETRDAAYRDNLVEYEDAVSATQQAVVAFQTQHGLISMEQFGQMVADRDALDARFETALDQARGLDGRADRIAELIDLPEDVASRVMVLRGDPSFEALREQLALAEAALAEFSRMYGLNHPEMRRETERHAGLIEAMGLRGEALLGVEAYRGLTLAEINLDDDRATLLRQMVDFAAQAAGARAEAVSLRDRLRDFNLEIELLSVRAAELDALLRAHQVAETVFASALARMDTSRSDIFAFYPLIQVLEPPALPSGPSSPSKKIAMLAAVGGFAFYCFGVMLLWLRLPLIRALWKIV
jgi:uncharacterized protein involved in exopolysaccharide biosynthesis